VLEHHSAGELVKGLDRLGIAARMREAPKARFLVVDEDTELQVAPWPHGLHRGG
jgi:hypothetical protein